MSVFNVNKLIDGAKFNNYYVLLYILICAVFVLDGYDLGIYGGVVPDLMKEWSLSPAEVGVIGSYVLVGFAFGALGLGALGDKFGRKNVTVVCIGVFSIFTGMCGLANNATEFSIYRVIAGVAMGGSFPNVIALASDYAPQPIRAFFIASPASTGMCIGGMASALIGIWLLPEYGWRSVFYVGVLPLVIVPFLMLHLPEAPINYIKRNRIAKLREILVRIRPDHTFPADATFEVTQQSLEKAPLIAVFQKNRAVSTIGIWAVYFMVTYMIYGLSFWMPKLMMNAGYPLKSALWFWFSVNAFGIVGIQLAGWFADRFSPKKVMYVVLLLAFVSITLLGVKSNFWIAILLAGLAGSSFQAAISVWNGYCANYYPPTMRSTGVGYAMCVARFGSILGPALSGLLMTMNVSAMSSFLGLSLPGLIGFFCLFLVNEKYSFTYGAKELANRPASNHNI